MKFKFSFFLPCGIFIFHFHWKSTNLIFSSASHWTIDIAVYQTPFALMYRIVNIREPRANTLRHMPCIIHSMWHVPYRFCSRLVNCSTNAFPTFKLYSIDISKNRKGTRTAHPVYLDSLSLPLAIAWYDKILICPKGVATYKIDEIIFH